MRKTFISLILAIAIICSIGCQAMAKEYDFENMTEAELGAVMTEITDEIEKNHRTTSSERSAIDDVVKGFVEEKYGRDNVDWAWIDYDYTKEWDYYALKTHADIKVGESDKRYDIYSELYKQGSSYELIFMQIGSQVYLDQRNDKITDKRIRTMLNLSVAENNEDEDSDAGEIDTVSVADQTSNDQEPEPTKKPMEFQPIKIWDESSENTVSQESSPVPTAIPTPTPTEVPLAKIGDCNETVRDVQYMLYKLGYLGKTPDSSFGDNTLNAVKKFQREYGFEETGTVTQAMYDKLAVLAANAPEPETPIYVTATQLYNAFKTNEVSAEATYQDRIVQVSGTIDSVKKGWFGSYYVELRADDWGFTTVTCYFDESDMDSIINMREGQYVTFKGKCNYSLSLVCVHNCIIVG